MDYIGIAGMAVFVMIWAITRMLDNPITCIAGRVDETAIIIEALQIAFIALLAILFAKRNSKN